MTSWWRFRRRRSERRLAARFAETEREVARRRAESRAVWAGAVEDWVEAAAPLRERWSEPGPAWLVDVWEWTLWSRGGWADRDGPLPGPEVAAVVADRLGASLPREQYEHLREVDDRVLALTAMVRLPEADVATRRVRLVEAAAGVIDVLPAVDDARFVEAAGIWGRIDRSLRETELASLDVERTLTQARWWPGRSYDVRPPFGRPDPLNLQGERRLSESFSDQARTWYPLYEEAIDVSRWSVDPVSWIFASLAHTAQEAVAGRLETR